jgi:acyl-coenzyme A synthetase/AMP-(fatty) acid ligase
MILDKSGWIGGTLRNPAVQEVTVIGVPGQYRGEAPKAFIKLREGK